MPNTLITPNELCVGGTKYDIIALGECLIDFLPASASSTDSLSYCGFPGGAPINVLVCNAQLGLKTAFIGKIGDDAFGCKIKSYLDEKAVDTSTMLISDKYPTTLTFVSLDSNGNRSFRFYRNETADCMLTQDEIPYSTILQSRIFHFGTVSMAVEPSCTATFSAAEFAHKNGVLVSFDPNIREQLWSSNVHARHILHRSLELADYVKLSQEELFFLQDGTCDIQKSAEKLFHTYHLKLLIVTLGGNGCVCISPCGTFSEMAYSVKTLDTTGAGDAFWGAVLYRLVCMHKDSCPWTPLTVQDMLRFANATGSMTTEHLGASPAEPEEIYYCINHYEQLAQAQEDIRE